MAPPLSDTNFVDEGSLIGIRQTLEIPEHRTLGSNQIRRSLIFTSIKRMEQPMENIVSIIYEQKLCKNYSLE